MTRVHKIKQIARGIKYRELTEYVGQRLLIHSAESLETDILQGLQPPLPAECRLRPMEQKHREMAIAKYGLIDVEFSVSDSFLGNHYQSGISLLKTVGFFPPKPNQADQETHELALEFAEIVVDEIVEQLAVNKCYVRMILDVDEAKHQLRLSLLPDYLPKTFVVRDACVTNAPAIWASKHFYL